LKQITPDNVKNLELQWVNQVQSRGNIDKWEATPLVVDGIMYTVRPPNEIFVLNAVSGRIFWIYTHIPADTARVCCGRVNRGLAILGDLPFMGPIEERLLAVNAKTGLERAARTARSRVFRDGGAADRQGPRNRGAGRGRVRHPRIPRGMQRENGRGGLALRHDPRARRAGA
jgi:glucose dehydrogenase